MPNDSEDTKMDIDNGIAAYQRYCEAVGGRTWDDKPIPGWQDLGDKVRRGWIAAGKNSEPVSPWLDVREAVQVMHAKDYAKNFSEAGVPGHSQFILIAKLAQALGL